VLKKLAVAVLVLVLLAAGLAAALWYRARDRTAGHLETAITGLTTVRPKPPKPKPKPPKPKPPPKKPPKPEPIAVDKPCWHSFGGNPQRSLARPSLRLGAPTKALWARGLKSYVEYPPTYCDGKLYVNTFRGWTFAVNAADGKYDWVRRAGGRKPSSPAIAGPYLIVSSTDGTVTALRRDNGRLVWQLRTGAKVESSPLVVDRYVYFGSTDGRLFSVYWRTGRVQWAYQTGGRINASPSVWGNRIWITTYAGSIFCLRRSDGHRLWVKYVKRDPFRYDSFYASASTDGRGVYTVSRSGGVIALSAQSGRVLWRHDVGRLGYSTPAIAYGRIFVGGWDGALHAFWARTGKRSWKARVGRRGRILGAPVVIGQLVFFSTLEAKTYAVRARDGKLVWRTGIGKYSPGIATDRHYYFTLNGILVAYRGRYSPPEPKPAAAARPKPKPRPPVKARKGAATGSRGGAKAPAAKTTRRSS
jgi:outer membrane protein assembly factor BamB